MEKRGMEIIRMVWFKHPHKIIVEVTSIFSYVETKLSLIIIVSPKNEYYCTKYISIWSMRSTQVIHY